MSGADLVSLLWSAPLGSRPDAALRKVCRAAGVEPAPFGAGNSKTAAPSTYRPVGPTCPASCPYLGRGCYAQSGRVALAAQRADDGLDAALAAAAAAMVWAARLGTLARLHVSGDFARDGAVDTAYVTAVADVASAVRERRGGTGPVAWAYTHLPDGPWVETLRAAGVAVRLSDRLGKHGAIVVADREHARAVRTETGERVAVCPAQLRPMTCAECRLCWSRPDVTVAFLAHGSGAGAVRRTVAQ